MKSLETDTLEAYLVNREPITKENSSTVTSGCECSVFKEIPRFLNLNEGK